MKSPKKHKHFIIKEVGQGEPFRPPSGGSTKPAPEQNQDEHGRKLKYQINMLQKEQNKVPSSENETESMPGLQVKFEGFPDVPLKSKSLHQKHLGIELLNVRHDKNANKAIATVFVSAGKLKHFEKIVNNYQNRKKGAKGRSLENKPLVNTIARIERAHVKDLWTDDLDMFPVSTTEQLWWEVWLRDYPSQATVIKQFREHANNLGIIVAKDELIFPERTVVLVYASTNDLQQSPEFLARIAELRNPKEVSEFSYSNPHEKPPNQLEKLIIRTTYPPHEDKTPYVCLLDTGVNRGHQLLAPALDSNDLYTIEPNWGTNDQDGHGTELAGLVLFGDLNKIFAGTNPLEITHRLESVKLLEPRAAGRLDPDLHGFRTAEAVARPEIDAPYRSRIFQLTISDKAGRDNGQPSSWSTAVDSLAAGVLSLADTDLKETNRRLLIVAAGNTLPDSWHNYPDSNDTDGIHDPAQAWNALTVGAYTNFVEITEPDAIGARPIAQRGELSPFSTTSLIWKQTHKLKQQRKSKRRRILKQNYTFKPDVVLEGGNAALDSGNWAYAPNSMKMLTTSNKPTARSFTATNGTSAATALASRLAAQILNIYPNLWPETVRALIVHSAEWTDAMKKSVHSFDKAEEKQNRLNLLHRYGFGVPNLDRALWTIKNSTTMVIEEEALQPFKQGPNTSSVKYGEMQIHSLPWPRNALERIGGTPVQMRVTLSYFIEPNPSRRHDDVVSHPYPSYGLRFDVKRPLEDLGSFRKRINLNARDKSEPMSKRGTDSKWFFGLQNRRWGSIHGDIWQGSAVELANRECIAVYPATGWWKTNPKQRRYNQTVRYALIVSIQAPETDVDLHAEIASYLRPTIKAAT